MSALLTLPQAQKALGMKGPRGAKLKRLIQAKERKLRREIMNRIQGRRRTTHRVSLTMLRRYMPELFPSEFNAMERQVRMLTRSLDGRMREIATEEIHEQVDPRLKELWERDERLAKNVKEVAKQVERAIRRIG